MLIHNETVQHMNRCGVLAERFGKFLNLDKNEIILLKECALLHDVGKFNIDTNILYKNGRLTQEEYEQVKKHTETKFISKYDEINEVIKYHHERIDGKGYYNMDLSILSKYTKIIGIIDSYDVMVSKRCYKSKKSKKESIQEIKNNLGTQFDEFYGHKFIEFINRNNITHSQYII